MIKVSRMYLACFVLVGTSACTVLTPVNNGNALSCIGLCRIDQAHIDGKVVTSVKSIGLKLDLTEFGRGFSVGYDHALFVTPSRPNTVVNVDLTDGDWLRARIEEFDVQSVHHGTIGD